MKNILVPAILIILLWVFILAFSGDTPYIEDKQHRYIIPRPWDLVYEDGEFKMILHLKEIKQQ